MTAQEFLTFINKNVTCEIDFTLPEQDTINLNQWGEVNRLKPTNKGRDMYTVRLDQDAIEMLAQLLRPV